MLAYDPTLRADEALHFFSARMGMFVNGVEISAFVDNVFNAAPEIGRYHEALGLNQYFVTTIRPRTIGLNVSYRY